MSAVLAPAISPIEGARVALAAVRSELDALDQRIADAQREVDAAEIAREAHRVATIRAVTEGRAVPKSPRLSADAGTVLQILRGQRVKLTERVRDNEGLLRRACVEEVEARKREALSHFAEASTRLIATWRELLALQGLLDQAGVRSEPLPPTLYSDFQLPALGRLRPICENHPAHFLASHALAPQGELLRMARATRLRIEADIKETLPW